ACVGGGKRRITDAVMPLQISRHLRHRPAAEVSGSRAQIPSHGAEPAGDERARLQISDPQRKLDSLLDEIDEPLAEANVEAHARIGFDILGDDRHHVTARTGTARRSLTCQSVAAVLGWLYVLT